MYTCIGGLDILNENVKYTAARITTDIDFLLKKAANKIKDILKCQELSVLRVFCFFLLTL